MTADEILKTMEAERIRRGLTMDELAADVDSSSSVYRRWMHKEAMPNLPTLVRYCAALGLVVTLKRRDEA